MAQTTAFNNPTPSTLSAGPRVGPAWRGSMGSALFGFFAGHILQLNHSYEIPFGIASCAYWLALIALYLLAPGLKKVEFAS
jgi:hypothetical protein